MRIQDADYRIPSPAFFSIVKWAILLQIGVFANLEQIVHFYNTRDTLGWVSDNQHPGFAKTGWPDPEISQNVNHDELGNMGLTPDEEKAIVAFMKTLTDDYPKWGKDWRVPLGTPSPFPKAKPPAQ